MSRGCCLKPVPVSLIVSCGHDLLNMGGIKEYLCAPAQQQQPVKAKAEDV